MRLSFLLALFLVGHLSAFGQASFDRALNRSYENYKENSLTNRRIKHDEIERIVQQLDAPFRVSTAGSSYQGRNIYEVTYGEGPVKVMLWSQMHGNEPTATMAMMDIFRFLQADDEFNLLRRQFRKKLTLVFVPMLNPDGAECYLRHNAQDLDLNRDAVNLESPEARLLKSLWEQHRPEWGFNLHDQNRYYAAGENPKPATISFLAPAYNHQKEVNTVRKRSMQLIGLLDQTLQPYIPGQVARYNDAFEPRAFGDNFQKWGTSTILIESGGLPGDPEKQEVRKLNFVALLTAFQAIVSERYRSVPLQTYEAIPYNLKNAFVDLAIRNVLLEDADEPGPVDITIRRESHSDDGELLYFNDMIMARGDLSDRYAYEDFVANGHRAEAGKVYPKVLSSWSDYRQLDHRELWKAGYTAVRMRGFSWDINEDVCLDELPRHFSESQLLEVLPENADAEQKIVPGRSTSMVLRKDNRVEYVIVNGRLIRL
ncbi:M14 family metallopeptidase [Flavilitoribacter nigricans]|uniref:Peptidase M14 n=1 Tax=Flavilitoribacter nigricans (strain ATCC 23147 / DSM 23189 / NBRC 102662 / NCIMB 1420 / SS-2) TaxID=1122177 RepID=A0A2D0NIV9_FLAN2|nr:M14 metallopeptidase family protein [Flavilitoribacter nigricans]PHN08296.1 peptidase M14 [Flavilitoribacter nigricans DSM 23189 = NBRC 102662]